MYSDWGKAAQRFIAELTADLPADATLEQRRKALHGHGPEFHGGTSWGKKVWPKEVRKYLELHGLPRRTVADASPLSKLGQRAQAGDITFPFREERQP